MVGNGQNTLRFGVIALGFGIALGTAHLEARAAEEEHAEAASTKQLALVKIEIKEPGGKVVANEGDLVEWNEDANVVIDAERRHAVTLELKREGDRTNKIKVKLAYDVDGQPIIAPHSFDTRVKKREVIRIEGGLAIAITVTPKTVQVEPPKKKREKIDGVGDPNDPLDGLD
jgi:hypothetical protein